LYSFVRLKAPTL